MMRVSLSHDIPSGVLTVCKYISRVGVVVTRQALNLQPAVRFSYPQPFYGGVIQRKFFITLILVFALSFSVFAADVNPSVTVQYKYGNKKSGSFSLSSSNASFTGKVSGYLSYTSGTVAVDDYSGSTTVFELSRVPSDFSVSTSTPGFSVSSSLSDGVATIVITADSSRESNLCGLDFSGEYYVGSELKSYVLGSGYTYTGSGTPPVVPPNPYEGTGSMFGWTGATLLQLELSQSEKWYTYGSGSSFAAQLDSLWTGMDGEGTLRGQVVNSKMLASLTWNKWKWSVDSNTGLPKFEVDSWSQGSWADMIYRTSVYNYFYASKLWSNDVSGSWYGSISTSFSYLNYRVNQILEVLANDEDLAIKDATTPEREWVKNYFNGSGDKADSDKYNSLNSDGQALKDFLTPSESASMSDALSAVESQGYSFWSENVYQDINQVSSTATIGLDDDVPWEEQINDLYSEHIASIWGAFYD